jgi:UDP-N-acetylmuramate: L-alanyl-gamma-D-glutamyl-meso-diaminopimelate ligase
MRSLNPLNPTHTPSKLIATIEAVKRQYPKRKLIAVFELHTCSSLNAAFLIEFAAAMNEADAAAVVYSKHSLELKRLPDLEIEKVREGFGSEDLQVFSDKNKLGEWIMGFIMKMPTCF